MADIVEKDLLRTGESLFHTGIAVFILFVGAGLRLFRVGTQSQWNDEAISTIISGSTVNQIIANVFHTRHPPGYYLLLHFWGEWLGRGDAALRLFSVAAGILSLVTIYLLGRSLFGAKTGLWAMAITALMPFHIYYSQEIRSYAILFLFSSLLSLAAVKIYRYQETRYWLLYTMTAVAGLYMHYFFALILATTALLLMLHCCLVCERRRLATPVLSFSLIVLAYVPMFPQLFGEVDRGNYWIKRADLSTFVSLPLAFTTGYFLERSLVMAGFAIILFLLVITLLQVGRAVKQHTDNVLPLIFTASIFLLPILVTYAVAIVWIPLTTSRLLIVAVPGLYILLAWGATLPKEKIANKVLILLLLFLALIADRNWLLNPAFQKPPVRQAAAFLEARAKKEEKIIYANDSGFRLFQLYAPDLDNYLFLDVNSEHSNPRVRPDVIRLSGGGIITPETELRATFWLVLHKDFDRELQEEIHSRFEDRYQLLESENVFGVEMYHYRSGEGLSSVVIAHAAFFRRVGQRCPNDAHLRLFQQFDCPLGVLPPRLPGADNQ